MRAGIFGLSGTSLTSEEAAFFKDVTPWGFILFARNIETPDQVRALTRELRDTVGHDAPILIDQEGGRVQRLRAPQWREWPAPLDQMAQVAPENARQAMELRYRIIAHELRDLGIDVNCAPMLDIATDASHEIILNRCYGHDVDSVADMGRAAADGLLAGGVLPIIKHIPGHGRANLDSHLELPVVNTPMAELDSTDFEAFRRLKDLPMAMTAHITYSDIDPENCATLSDPMMSIIRRKIGFKGLLMSDDLSMKALSGSLADRVQKSLFVGVDMMLHCNGDMDEMQEVASNLPRLSGGAKRRAAAALELRKTPEAFDIEAADATFASLL
ncbi:glycosyl hydrolase [Amylibacter marinus]|uniref:beta-N-acetylhexosaminidase n=1 Tax=Amylibacter marinus TaxID=1475483 RepID=A0ABQ5VTP0_9RHOB|nr:beta-N-acetylhexosaminidase [Amylibacter marinus]GLQ34808.1 glycosyl hydrolase [Amylibacter marinus]